MYTNISKYGTISEDLSSCEGLGPRNTPGQMAPNSLASSSTTGAVLVDDFGGDELKLNESSDPEVISVGVSNVYSFPLNTSCCRVCRYFVLASIYFFS